MRCSCVHWTLTQSDDSVDTESDLVRRLCRRLNSQDPLDHSFHTLSSRKLALKVKAFFSLIEISWLMTPFSQYLRQPRIWILGISQEGFSRTLGITPNPVSLKPMFEILPLLDCLHPYISQTTQKQLSIIISAMLAISGHVTIDRRC